MAVEKWLTGWENRKKINIQGQSGAGTNYQIVFGVGESVGASDYDFHLNGNSQDFPSAKNDGGDLRFTDNDGETLLDFWVESVSGTTPNRTAKIWVEVADNLDTDQSIYCYYNNASASNYSNGEDTFPFFDDFDDGSLDTSKWTVLSGSVSESGDSLELDNNDEIEGDTAFGKGYAHRARSKADEQDIVFCALRSDTNNRLLVDNSDLHYSDDFDRIRFLSTKEGSQPSDIYHDGWDDFRNTYSIYEIQNISDSLIKYSQNENNSSYSDSTYIPTVDLPIWFWVWDSSQESTLTVDWSLIRKCIETEPSFIASYSEESSEVSWLNNWAYRMEIETEPNILDYGHTHIAIPLFLGTSVGSNNADNTPIFDEIGSDYKKIAITSDDGTTQLYGEVEKWDTINEKAVIWVSKSDWFLDANTYNKFYIYYDNSESENTTYIGDPGSRTEVWDSDIKLRYGMNQDPSSTSPQIIDSTSNNNDGTSNGSMTSGDIVDGKVGDALVFDNNDYINGGSDSSLDVASDIIVSIWAYITDLPSWSNINDQRVILLDKMDGSRGYTISVTDNLSQTTGTVTFIIGDSGGYKYINSNATLSENTWHHIMATYDGDELRLYIDDGWDKTKTVGSQAINDSADLTVPHQDDYGFSGKIDELVIYDTAYSSGQYNILHYSQTDELLIWGSETEKPITSVELGDTLNISDDFYLPAEEYDEFNIADDINVITGANDIDSDFRTVKEVKGDIDSKIHTAREIISDLSNDLRTIKEVEEELSNYFNSVISVISDVDNNIKFLKSNINDVDNKINSKKQSTHSVANDFRMLTEDQIPGEVGFQSKGKEYIKVWIDGVEQTDVDIDTINISRNIDSASTAQFTLARAYDENAPNEEEKVVIKYDDYKLYTGYIVDIDISDDPDVISVRCQDKAWKDNRDTFYFRVGHNVTDDSDIKQYYTIYQALDDIYSLTSPSIGNFVPRSMDMCGTNKFNALVELVNNSGNYNVYYDVDENLKVQTRGEGSIVTLDAQVLGENIKLHNVINHSFKESVENLVNKFFVQMGNEVIKRTVDGSGDHTTEGSTTYRISYEDVIVDYPQPAWYGYDKFEKLVINNNNRFGYDYPDPLEEEYKYDWVFSRYYLPSINAEDEEWSDIRSPAVHIEYPYDISDRYNKATHPEGYNWEGFSIDYEHGLLTFGQPVYITIHNEYEEPVKIRRAILTLKLWKEKYYEVTIDGDSSYDSDDWDENNVNELSFFTDKMGNYAETITGFLSLTGLNKRDSYSYEDADGTTVHVNGYNDTNFARDLADWELSKKCDKTITGVINITLDTLKLYDIDLNKRIKVRNAKNQALNINSINIDVSNFTVEITLENGRKYKRTVSYPLHDDSSSYTGSSSAGVQYPGGGTILGYVS